MALHKKQNFDVSGPRHLLNSWDWNAFDHQKSIVASLVHGVYILEKERKRNGHDTYARPWWERFHFKLHSYLVDDNDSSYFGAIYELKNAPPCAPKYVIAFRGTAKQFRTLFEDMKLNFKFVYGHPKESPRFEKAFEAVCETVTMAGAENVWLAGHSLGASIAMLAGRELAKRHFYLKTYLFNPPFNSVSIEYLIKNDKLKHNVRIWGSLMKAAIAKMMKLPDEDSFITLSKWKPNLFVNPSDPVCAKYITYFQHMGKVERIAANCSFRSLGYRAIGRELEPWHLLPTAKLTVNRSLTEDLSLIERVQKGPKAHEIDQWWQEPFEGSTKTYRF